jgi:hypothetical protein
MFGSHVRQLKDEAWTSRVPSMGSYSRTTTESPLIVRCGIKTVAMSSAAHAGDG